MIRSIDGVVTYTKFPDMEIVSRLLVERFKYDFPVHHIRIEAEREICRQGYLFGIFFRASGESSEDEVLGTYQVPYEITEDIKAPYEPEVIQLVETMFVTFITDVTEFRRGVEKPNLVSVRDNVGTIMEPTRITEDMIVKANVDVEVGRAIRGTKLPPTLARRVRIRR